MTLDRYLSRLQAIVYSRREIEVETLVIREQAKGKTRGTIAARLSFYDGSFLELSEALKIQGRSVIKLYYSYHYQRGERCIFRYDNTPHHPELEGFPNHKHIGDEVLPADPPDLGDVLREIDASLYSTQASE